MDPKEDLSVTAEVCAHIKRSGYAQSQIVRIYGEEFEILSDPFPNERGARPVARGKAERNLYWPRQFCILKRSDEQRK